MMTKIDELFEREGKQIEDNPTFRTLYLAVDNLKSELQKEDLYKDKNELLLARYFVNEIEYLFNQAKEKIPIRGKNLEKEISNLGSQIKSFLRSHSLDEIIHNLGKVSNYVNEFLKKQDRYLLTENEAYGFDGDVPLFGVKPGEEKYIAPDGLEEKDVLVNMDIWLKWRYGRDWLVNEYTKGIKELEKKGDFGALCFVKKEEGSVGPIFLASSILKALGDRMLTYVFRPLYECEEDQIEGDLIVPKESVCIVYDSIHTGVELKNIRDSLINHGVGRCAAVVFFEYKTGEKDVDKTQKLDMDYHVILKNYTKERLRSILKTDYEAPNELLLKAIEKEIMCNVS